MATKHDPRLERLDPRDREYAERLPDEEREVVVATVARYRQADRLRMGDELPALAAARLEDASRVELHDLTADRPLLLVFGSFT